MNLTLKDGDYIPHYTRTDLADNLHDKFGFRTDFEIISEKISQKFVKKQKNRKSTQNLKQKKSL